MISMNDYLGGLVRLHDQLKQIESFDGVKLLRIWDREVHVYTGIEKLAFEAGEPMTVKTYYSDLNPYFVFFKYGGIKFFQLFTEDEWTAFVEDEWTAFVEKYKAESLQVAP